MGNRASTINFRTRSRSVSRATIHASSELKVRGKHHARRIPDFRPSKRNRWKRVSSRFLPSRQPANHRSGNDSRSRVLWSLTRRYPVLRGGERSHSFLFSLLRFTSVPLILFRLFSRSSRGDDNWREPRRDSLPGEALECSSQFSRPCQRKRERTKESISRRLLYQPPSR